MINLFLNENNGDDLHNSFENGTAKQFDNYMFLMCFQTINIYRQR